MSDPDALSTRNDEIVRRVQEGEHTFRDIARDFGLSAERVRQIATPHVEAQDRKEKARQRRNAKRLTTAEALTLAVEVARRDTTITTAEIARQVGDLTRQEVEEALGKEETLRRAALARPPLGRQHSKDTIRDAIKRVAEAGGTPVTMSLYRQHSIDGDPSTETILSLYGAWRDACEDAGVAAGGTASEKRRQRWSDEALIEEAMTFYNEAGSRASMDAYDAWSKSHGNKPSAALLRRRFGSWGAVRTRVAAALTTA